MSNVLYTWVTANSDNNKAFIADFINNVVEVLGVNAEDVAIVSLTSGSVIVDFTIKTSNPTAVSNAVSTYVASSNPSLAFPSLPPSAYQDQSQGASLNSSKSGVNYNAAIIGAVVGGGGGLIIIVLLVAFIIRKRRNSPAGLNRVRSTKGKTKEKETLEMID